MTLVNAFYALGGVLLGWLGSVVGYFVKIRRERNRAIRKSLFLLLEIWNDLRVANALDMNVWVKEYFAELERRFPDVKSDTERMSSEIRSRVVPLVLESAASTLANRGSLTIDAFNEVIGRLAEEEPLLAYRLNGRQGLRSALVNVDELFAKVNEQLPEFVNDPDVLHVLEGLTTTIRDGATTDIILELEEDILYVAAKVWNKWKVRALIGRAHRRDIEAITSSIKLVVDELEQRIKECEQGNSTQKALSKGSIDSSL